MKRFEGKIVVVTGAGRGVGLTTAKEFAEEGATVIAAELDEQRGRDIEVELKRVSPDSAFIQVNIADQSSVQGLFGELISRYGRLDVAINNAAFVSQNTSNLMDMPIEQFDKVMAVNARGTFFCMQSQLRIMVQQKCGVIVNVASQSGHWGFPGHVDYAASKHAVMALTRTAALEVARENVRVVAVSPGAINTPLNHEVLGDEFVRTIGRPIPIGRMAEPREIARGIMFLASDDAAIIVGHTLHLDGGMVDIPRVWWAPDEA